MDTYQLADHRHRFAAWCASTAARASPNCRFRVKEGLALIERGGLRNIATSWETLPEPQHFKRKHQRWRDKLRQAAPEVLGERRAIGFTHGVAAKLINIYLKSIFVSAIDAASLPPSLRAKRDAIHPPIDGLLIKALSLQGPKEHRLFWQNVRPWSLLSSTEYQEAITTIEQMTAGQLWRIEHYWSGHRL